MAVTLKFQSSGAVPGQGAPVQMQGGSMTVGRGPANDVVLPDPDRVLSKSHFVVEDHNGNVVVVDLSTNGTFLNYAKIPLGPTPTPLNNGDVLIAGPYEMVIEIGAGVPDPQDMLLAPAGLDPISPGRAENAPDPLQLLDDAGPGGDFLDDLLGGEKPTGPGQLNPVDPIDELLPPLGEEEDPFFQKPSDGMEGYGGSAPMHNPSATDAFSVQSTEGPSLIPDDWDDLLAPTEPEPAPAPPPAAPPPQAPAPQAPPVGQIPPIQNDPLAANPVAPAPGDPLAMPDDTIAPTPAQPAEPPAAQPAAAPAPAPAAASGPSEAARAFLSSVGAEDVQIDDADLEKTMARMGRIMKTLVTGLREILMTRTSIKSEFRIEQTTIGAGGNNPLKFSMSAEQAVEAMVRPATKGYLSPESAAEEALDDIKAHEVAMVTGMEAALKGVLGKLDPAELAGKIETSGALGSLFKGKKARYWEVYEKMYAEISDQAENDFHDLFSREFARAYQEQLNKLKTK
ncbi:MAG: type VI secretion system-associated FHA domain protein TagH [Paracoccaceae bacterium]